MSKIREILDNLSTEQYKMMIGEKSCQPLTETFSKKRVVHPGANGQMVPPVKQQEIWLEYMQRKGDKSKKKAVYILLSFYFYLLFFAYIQAKFLAVLQVVPSVHLPLDELLFFC